MMQSKVYAVTGGIGSGKSAVMKIIAEMGYPTLSCDEISAQLWKEPEYLAGLAALFPDCVENGVLRKDWVAKSVFCDENRLKLLDSYAHPRIMDRLMREAVRYPVAFAEVPLLYEGGFEDLFDGVIAVRREKGERLKSVVLRDGLSEKDALSRMERQFDPEKLGEKRCMIIENDASLDKLKEKVKICLDKLM